MRLEMRGQPPTIGIRRQGFFFFKQKTAYEIETDWSSDVCSSDLVVHPSHVPLEAEPQAAQVHRARHHGPRRRLLGDGLDVGVLAVDLAVEPPQEAQRLEVLQIGRASCR